MKLLLALLLMACPLPTEPRVETSALMAESQQFHTRQRPVTRAGFTVELTAETVTVRGNEPLYTVGFDRSWYRPCRTVAGVCTVRRSQGRIEIWIGGASGEPVWKEAK